MISRPVVCSEGLVELELKHGFWLKPIAKLLISVQIAKLKLAPGQTLSTVEVMEKLRKQISPVRFLSLKVAQTSLENLTLEAEFDTVSFMNKARDRIDNVKLYLDSFEEHVRVNTSLKKFSPTRHEWETFFRDCGNMDETQPGYRPDTIHLQRLPLKWFGGGQRPKTQTLIDVFSSFGSIRRFHIPLLDQLDGELKGKEQAVIPNGFKLTSSGNNETSGFKKFDFNLGSEAFDAYIMYNEHQSFVNAIEQLRGMKLVKQMETHKEKGRPEYHECEFLVDFDRTHHLSDKAIRKRQMSKKYGIKSLEDLNEYKQKVSETKLLLDKRISELEIRKQSAENLLIYLLRRAELAEMQRLKMDEEQRQERMKQKMIAKREKELKERLLEEEERLRQKLLERKREQVCEQLKDSGQSLRSVAVNASGTIKVSSTNYDDDDDDEDQHEDDDSRSDRIRPPPPKRLAYSSDGGSERYYHHQQPLISHRDYHNRDYQRQNAKDGYRVDRHGNVYSIKSNDDQQQSRTLMNESHLDYHNRSSQNGKSYDQHHQSYSSNYDTSGRRPLPHFTDARRPPLINDRRLLPPPGPYHHQQQHHHHYSHQQQQPPHPLYDYHNRNNHGYNDHKNYNYNNHSHYPSARINEPHRDYNNRYNNNNSNYNGNSYNDQHAPPPTYNDSSRRPLLPPSSADSRRLPPPPSSANSRRLPPPPSSSPVMERRRTPPPSYNTNSPHLHPQRQQPHHHSSQYDTYRNNHKRSAPLASERTYNR